MFGFNQYCSKEGEDIYSLIKELFPICRSLTGDGVRQTLYIIKKLIPIEVIEAQSGTKVFDWTVPQEWNIKDAYIKNSKGKKIIDFNKSNLHVLNYSIPINKKLSKKELEPHLFSLPDHPNWIPYLTSYYNEDWGFCLTHKQFKELKEDTYHVVIDSTLENGFLTYGELHIKGKIEDEILFSCYICHPSLCNDNLTGPAILTYLAKTLLKENEKGKLKYSYKFLFIPETIGAITWLNKNEEDTSKIKAGLVATCLGDSGKSTYKKSRRGNGLIDLIVEKVLIDSGEPFEILDFWPSGSDERQFCSLGFDLPIGSLMRTVYGKFPEYHSSADNLDFIKPEFLANSFKKYLNVVFILENNRKYLNLNPKCEPQLGKRGLYSKIGGLKESPINELAILWVLMMSDGINSLLDISKASKLKFNNIKTAADLLVESELLKELRK